MGQPYEPTPYIQAAHAAMADALARHPECAHAEWTNGLAFPFTPTIVVNLWRTEECYLAGDPPRHTCEGYNPNAAVEPSP